MNEWIIIIIGFLLSILLGLLIGGFIFIVARYLNKRSCLKKIKLQKEKFIIGGKPVSILEDLENDRQKQTI